MSDLEEQKQPAGFWRWLGRNAVYIVGCTIVATTVFAPDGYREWYESITGRQGYLAEKLRSKDPSKAYRYISRRLPIRIRNSNAAREGHFDISGSDSTRNWPLAEAAPFKPDMVHLLLRRGVQVNERELFGRSALHYAQDYECVSALLNAGADPNLIGGLNSTPLDVTFIGNVEKIQLLLEHGGLKCAGYISARDYQEGARYTASFTYHHIGFASDDYNQFLDFSQTNHLQKKLMTREETIQSLLDQALQSSTDREIGRTIDLLLTFKPDLNQVDPKTGLTPLMIVCKFSTPHSTQNLTPDPVVLKLIEAGAKLDTVNPKNGYTALHYAVKNHCYPIVLALVQKGARADIKDKTGKTPRGVLENIEGELR